MSREIILNEAYFGFSNNSDFNCYSATLKASFLTNLEISETYIISWDKNEWSCTSYELEINGLPHICFGNAFILNLGEDTQEPFIITYDKNLNILSAYTSNISENTHQIAIYKENIYTGIILRNPKGTAIAYGDYKKIRLTKADGNKVIYSEGEGVSKVIDLDFSDGNDMDELVADGELISELTITIPETLLAENIAEGVKIAGVSGSLKQYEQEAKYIRLDFSKGDMTVTPNDGKLISQVTIPKPYYLRSNYIAPGVTIAGIEGTYVTPSEDITVQLNMADGNQVVTHSDGKLISTVTIEKPAGLIPDNIAEGMEIAGVVGTHTGGGGGDGGYTIAQIAARTLNTEISDDTLTSIGSYAFAYTNITTASFPMCTTVGNGAFYNCTSLSSITIDYSNLISVPSYAFYSTQISNIDLPLCTSIYSNAFAYCYSLETITLPAISYIQFGAFQYCSSLKNVSFNPAYSELASATFRGCTNLESFDDDIAFNSVGASAFYNCHNLKEINLCGRVKLNQDAFYCCSKLSKITNLTRPSGTEFLAFADRAFAHCQNLKSIDIGYYYSGSTQSHISDMFYGCISLSKVTLISGTKLFSINSNWFHNTPINNSSYLGKYGSIYVPSTLYTAFRSAYGWSNYSARMVSYTV